MTRPPTIRIISTAIGAPSDSAPLADEAPQYIPVGNGRFVPANDAAYREVECWNAYADAWNARTAARSLRP